MLRSFFGVGGWRGKWGGGGEEAIFITKSREVVMIDSRVLHFQSMNCVSERRVFKSTKGERVIKTIEKWQ